MSLRPIDIAGFDRPPPHEAGPAPQLMWLPVARLVVDPAYQREISRIGRRNIETIAAAFSWRAFSPVVVSPVTGGLYAIIDGQHRTTAAALIGIEEVPCNIILASQADQARAFSAINGNATRIHSMTAFWASVTAGDEQALATRRVATAAGVTILKYPVPTLKQEPGQTMACAAIGRVINDFGEATATLALRLIVETKLNNARGMIISPLILALGDTVNWLASEGWTEERMLAAAAKIRLIREYDKACQEARQSIGLPIHKLLARRLRATLRAQG